MKQFFVVLLLAAFIIGCNNATEKKEGLNMGGAYSMISQNVKSDSTDTTYTNYKQLKLYLGDFMMYGGVNPADSVSGFGVGTITENMDTITENVMFNASDTSKSENPGTFKLVIEKTAKGYKQIIPDMGTANGQKYTLTEEYETVGTSATSPLDGLWKQVKGYSIKGTDTTNNVITQYKMYSAGHFMFGHSYADSTNKLHTGIGYGTFSMDGTTKLKESILATTYASIRGMSFDISIELTGTDAFKQTITNADGTKDVEFYERVKK